MTKLEKEDKQEKGTQKDSKIPTKLLTIKLSLEICQCKRIKIPQGLNQFANQDEPKILKMLLFERLEQFYFFCASSHFFFYTCYWIMRMKCP